MKTILKISFRNLIRQKRRNLLLGLGIAFGMGILIVSNSFSQGISDVLLNKFILWLTGHVRVATTEKYEKEWEIIRDKNRIEQFIREQIPGDIQILEDVSTEGRALGKGGVESVFLKGVDLQEGFFQGLQTSSGNLEDLMNPNIENPVMIYGEMAENLHVEVNDRIQVAFQTVYRQMESANFTVVAILQGGLPIIDTAAYTHINTLKPLLGYKEHETGALNVVIKNLDNPDSAVEYANRLHQALQPGVAGYEGMLNDRSARIFAVAAEQEALQQFASQVSIVTGSIEKLNDVSTIMLSQTMADTLGVKVGDEMTSTYQTRFEGMSPVRDYRVVAIFKANEAVAGDMVFVSEKEFQNTFYPLPPKSEVTLDQNHALASLLAQEWRLLERTVDQDALEKKYDELAYSDWRGKAVDVQTMYERASDVLRLEVVLDVLTLAAVMVLFFIILIGVVNTLQMTIRERTREIGTVRAIGMQGSDVWWSFTTEVLLLALIASLVGLAGGMITIQLLKLVPVEPEGLFVLLLVDDHLHFVPTIADMVKNMGIILMIAFVTAFFPARRAAKLSVAEALRHYE